HANIRISIARYLSTKPNQLYRIRFNWVATNGLSRFPGIQPYVFVTSSPSQCRFDRSRLGVGDMPTTPFELNGPQNSYPVCVPRRGGVLPGGAEPVVAAEAYFPLLIAAIDPVQEDRLVHLGN